VEKSKRPDGRCFKEENSLHPPKKKTFLLGMRVKIKLDLAMSSNRQERKVGRRFSHRSVPGKNQLFPLTPVRMAVGEKIQTGGSPSTTIFVEGVEVPQGTNGDLLNIKFQRSKKPQISNGNATTEVVKFGFLRRAFRERSIRSGTAKKIMKPPGKDTYRQGPG